MMKTDELRLVQEWDKTFEKSKKVDHCKVTFVNRYGITLAAGEYALGGGVVDPLPEDAPFFVKDYYDYYKTDRGYHERSLNSNGGWNVTGCESFMNQPILMYSNEIRNAVLIVHGTEAHSFYFGKDAYDNMISGSNYTDNKEFMPIEGAVHTDLYDGGANNAIPWDKLESFFTVNMK